jgi:hypothetical protein
LGFAKKKPKKKKKDPSHHDLAIAFGQAQVIFNQKSSFFSIGFFLVHLPKLLAYCWNIQV